MFEPKTEHSKNKKHEQSSDDHKQDLKAVPPHLFQNSVQGIVDDWNAMCRSMEVTRFLSVKLSKFSLALS